MSEEFVVRRVRRVRRRRLKGKATPSPIPNETKGESVLPQYLMDPPATSSFVELEGNHTKELVCAYRVAKEILGSSFRPKESNLAVGKIRV